MVSDEGNGLIEHVYVQQFLDMPLHVPDMANRPRVIMVCADFNNGGDNETSVVAITNAVGCKVVSFEHFHSIFLDWVARVYLP